MVGARRSATVAVQQTGQSVYGCVLGVTRTVVKETRTIMTLGVAIPSADADSGLSGKRLERDRLERVPSDDRTKARFLEDST